MNPMKRSCDSCSEEEAAFQDFENDEKYSKYESEVVGGKKKKKRRKKK